MPRQAKKGPKATRAKKATTARRKRHRMLAWVAALAMAGVVALVIAAVVIMLRNSHTAPPTAVPPSVEPTPPTSSLPHKPRPASQDGACPDVLLVNAPGTWESSLQDDPANPVQFPNALLH